MREVSAGQGDAPQVNKYSSTPPPSGQLIEGCGKTKTSAKSVGVEPQGNTEKTEQALSVREESLNAREEVAHQREETADRRDSVAQEREKVVLIQETAREEVTQIREETADQRDAVTHIREQAVKLREQVAASHEKIVREAGSMTTAYEKHMANLREANEQLAIATVEAQTLTDEIQKSKDQLGHMAHHDALTDLPNRILLQERLNQAIALAKRHGTKLAVLFIDLDRFKAVNDSMGHAIGDALLQSVAQRLVDSIRSTDTACRLGGDEFVALLSEIADEKAASGFADKIYKAVSAPYCLAERAVHVGATIGISMYPDDGTDAEMLINNADAAMYQAKRGVGDNFLFFKPEMNARALQRHRIEEDLRRALEDQEFELYYQAQVDLQTGLVIGAEALIRWHHPVDGLLLPGGFIPVAEDCGAIVPIGHWVLREACRQTQAWFDAGLTLQVIAVNISGIEFAKEDFFENVLAVLRETGLAPHHLELELTETVLMENVEATATKLQAFKSLGIKIGIDDFGTGYSSLSYLKQFPIDTLKIDQSFIAGIASNGADDILVESVIGLGKGLKHRVIAEGLETCEQLAFLKHHQCNEVQGYYLSPPMNAEQFAGILKNGISMESFSAPLP